MLDDKFEQVIYLICKSLTNSEISKLELYREVKNGLVTLFGDVEPIKKLTIFNQQEDFNDILNFVVTILIELGIIIQKNESNNPNLISYKWYGIKGFTKKYLSSSGLIIKKMMFEELLNFEKQIQIFTRIFISYLVINVNANIDIELTQHLSYKCNLIGHEVHVDKIIAILMFLDFISANEKKLILNLDLFNRGASGLKNVKNIMDETILRPLYTEPEQFTICHNETILKKVSYWETQIKAIHTEREKKMREKIIEKNKKYEKKPQEEEKKIKEEIPENIVNNLICSEEKLNEKMNESGFALLKGDNWSYLMKKLNCIIGRLAEKHSLRGFVCENQEITYDLDVNLGSHKRISKQHAFISFNFSENCFEIKNISKKFCLQVNGEDVLPGNEMPLSSRSVIKIGHKEFYFLLPIEN